MIRLRTASIVSILMALFGSAVMSPVYAACPEQQQDTALQLLNEASATVDEIDRLILLKRSAKVCSSYEAWLELGQVELRLENTLDAAYAFENAADFYKPDSQGTHTAVQVQRKAVANAWLAETYVMNDDMALASVAVQASAEQFAAIGQPSPDRLLRLQARLDDAMSRADASVLARSFELQHKRQSRGIGVRLRLFDETAETVETTQAIVAEYTGEPVEETEVAMLDGVSEEPTVTEPDAGSEARLNIPVLFRFDSAELSDESMQSVTQLAAALISLELTAEDSVLVVGHTDSRGAADYNQLLSERRAASVNDSLRSMLAGTDVMLSAEGRGETELRYLGSSRDDHRRNRRVELVVLRQ